MGAFAKGVFIAAAVAGPSLYALVKEGSLDSTQAIERGAVVAVGVAVGVTFVEQLVDSYRRDARRRHLMRQIPEHPELPEHDQHGPHDELGRQP